MSMNVQDERVAVQETQVADSDVMLPGKAASTSVATTRVTRYPVGYRAINLIWLVVGAVDVVLFFDFLFRALNANDTGFADLIYGLGGFLAAPFDGIFNQVINNSVIGVTRWADLMAIVIYTLVGGAIVTLVRMALAPRDV